MSRIKPIKPIQPIVTEVSSARVVLPKSVFNDIIKQLNLLTETVNTLASNQSRIHRNTVTLAKSLDALQED